MKKFVPVLVLSFLACNSDADGPAPVVDAGPPDASGHDAGELDAALVDGGELDATIEPSIDAALDASDAADAAVDAEVDAFVDAATCQPTVLLAGGADVTPQGWTTVMQAPNSLSLVADYVRLETSDAMNGRTSGMLLLAHAGVQAPFKLELVLQIESVQPHNSLDSAAAILGSFTPPFGNSDDRKQMIYIDSNAIGWADDTQSAPASVVDAQPHTFTLFVDAQNVAHVALDGVDKLTRNNFVTNGTVAIGDQTNDPGVNAVMRIQSIKQLCL